MGFGVGTDGSNYSEDGRLSMWRYASEEIPDARGNFILGTTRSGCFDISCCSCDGWKRPAQLAACFLILSSITGFLPAVVTYNHGPAL
jgi:hypothetical protein